MIVLRYVVRKCSTHYSLLTTALDSSFQIDGESVTPHQWRNAAVRLKLQRGPILEILLFIRTTTEPHAREENLSACGRRNATDAELLGGDAVAFAVFGQRGGVGTGSVAGDASSGGGCWRSVGSCLPRSQHLARTNKKQ